jgi:hypothetical protein
MFIAYSKKGLANEGVTESNTNAEGLSTILILDTGNGTNESSPIFTTLLNTSFKSSDWKAGDKASWEQALRARAQDGQNDYAKSN